MNINKVKVNSRWKVEHISHQFFDYDSLNEKEKITYLLVLLFVIFTVASMAGILFSLISLTILFYGTYRFLEKRWLQSAISMEDVSSLMELIDADQYEQAEKIDAFLESYRETLKNPDLTNKELAEIVELLEKELNNIPL